MDHVSPRSSLLKSAAGSVPAQTTFGVVERGIFPPQQARVVLINEQREVWTKFAVFVAEPLGQRRVRAYQALERLPDRRRVEGHVTRAAGETAVGAVQQHPHPGTTIGQGA